MTMGDEVKTIGLLEKNDYSLSLPMWSHKNGTYILSKRVHHIFIKKTYTYTFLRPETHGIIEHVVVPPF